jgi:hypothetical protein
MVIDMHYYGMYAIARAAGLKEHAAQIAASASQYVDDSVSYDIIYLPDGGTVCCTVTAHHSTDTKNIEIADQRFIWVPFHFLPGGSGQTMNEKLVCVKNGEIAQKMAAQALKESGSGLLSLIRMGITLHVYADTFSHFGFSGISSPLNKVDNSSIEFNISDPGIKKYVTKKNKRFVRKEEGISSFTFWLLKIKERVVGGTAEFLSHALGHGSVSSCPDRPFLNWTYKYEESGKKEVRDNPSHFIHGAEEIFDLLKKFCAANPEFKESEGCSFASIKEILNQIILFEGTEEERILKWKNAVISGLIFSNPDKKPVPEYKGISWDNAKSKAEKPSAVSDEERTEAVTFHRAAEAHQSYVLKTLLPLHGINIV